MDKNTYITNMRNKFKLKTTLLEEQLDLYKQEQENISQQFYTLQNRYNEINNSRFVSSRIVDNKGTDTPIDDVYTETYSSVIINKPAKLRELQRQMDDLEKEINEYNDYINELLVMYNRAKMEETDDFIGYQVKGFLDKSIMNELLDGSETTGYILPGLEYRPDKIALFYYDDYTMYWIIGFVNNIMGLEGYYKGRQILIPTKERIGSVLT